MRKRRQIEVFSISFLDLLSGALGAVIILYVAIPKNNSKIEKPDVVTEIVKAELASVKIKNQKLEEELKALKAVTVPRTVSKIDPSAAIPGGADLDIGFKFKGKNIVFVIDTSYSMIEEDRMGQVKAGLKMLITSLPPSYKIDIIQYPLGERSPFKSLWGDLKEITNFNKADAFDFIYSMRPLGGTPTRDALLFVLRNYGTTSDIVLLTDGAPTLHNSNRKDDIFDILKVVKEENAMKTQINVIGVGADFIRDKQSERYKFLNLLSEQHKGFFVGF